jgi:hypothetical protein
MNSSSTENHRIEGLSTGLEGQDHQEKRHKVLMCDTRHKSRIETPSNRPHENPPKIASKITKKEKWERQQMGDKELRQTFHTSAKDYLHH